MCLRLGSPDPVPAGSEPTEEVNMRARISAVIAAALMLSGVLTGVAHAPPDPNGPARYGLCKAYFSGSENGQEHKRKGRAFQALEQAAGVDEDDSPEEIDQKVADFCEGASPGGRP
jgi:hypothetical protein